MQIRSAAASDAAAIHRLLCANGWAHRIADAAHLGRLISASQQAVVALAADGGIVGFGRPIRDGISNGYLSRVVGAEPLRRQGIGQALVRHILGLETDITWVLRADRPGAAEFFARLGFSPSSAAMERPRKQRLRMAP